MSTFWIVVITLAAVAQLKGMWWAWRFTDYARPWMRAILTIFWPVTLVIALCVNPQ